MVSAKRREKRKETKMKTICSIALVMLFSFAAFGVNDDAPDKLDGNELAAHCKESTEGFDAGYCLGIVEGLLAPLRRSAITLRSR